MDEQALIRQAKRGDKQSMEALFRSHVDSAVRTAYMITHNWATAEDAVQEAFIQAFRSLGTFQEGRPFKPWLTKIVVNKSRRIWAKFHSPWDELDQQVPDNSGHNLPEAEVLNWERRTRLIQAIKHLGEKHRLPLVLKYLSGLTEAEIGEVLGIPASTVKSRLFVARKQLAQKLADLEGGEQRGKA
ncbi:MAG: RNA polymerase sigma factor [Firmicutes bacterium]|nr:RNA polymerase sigma factor [Bacillota bacterium]